MYEIAATFLGDKVVPVEKTQTMFYFELLLEYLQDKNNKCFTL